MIVVVHAHLTRCGSPTCRAGVSTPTLPPSEVEAFLVAHGWQFQRQPGDGRAYWYCPRCIA